MDISKAYLEFAPGVYRYALVKLDQNKEDAEDVTSETFLRLMKTTEKVVEPKAWVFTIARNVIYERYRDLGKTRGVSLDENQYLEAELPDNFNTEDMAISDALYSQIEGALKSLDDITREVIVLRVWEEMKFGQIAEILHESEDAVKKRFYRGIEKLKQMLEQDQDRRAPLATVRSISLPIILLGLSQMAKDPAYAASKSYLKRLFINSHIMENTVPTATSTVAPATKAFWATPKGLGIIAGIGFSVLALIILIIAFIISGGNSNPGSGNSSSSSGTTTIASGSAASSESTNMTTSIAANTQTAFKTVQTRTYSMQIPSDWVYIIQPNTDAHDRVYIGPKSTGIWEQDISNCGERCIDEFMELSRNSIASFSFVSYGSPINNGNITVDGLHAVISEGPDNEDGGPENTLIVSNKLYAQYRYEYRSTFRQIVATIDFNN